MTVSPPPRGEARAQILETTWRLIETEGAAAATLVRVARETGVSRQAVYLFFGNRAGLLEEVLAWHDRTKSGIGRRFRKAMIERPGARAIASVIGVWMDYLPVIDPVARIMEAAAVTDEDAERAWNNRQAAYRAVLLAVLRRAEKRGELAPGWTGARAADLAHALTQGAAWRRLREDAGWRDEEVREALSGLVTRTLFERAPED